MLQCLRDEAGVDGGRAAVGEEAAGSGAATSVPEGAAGAGPVKIGAAVFKEGRVLIGPSLAAHAASVSTRSENNVKAAARPCPTL